MWMTPHHFHTIPTSCAIQVANCAHHKTLHARSLFIHTQWTSYSAVLTPVFHRSISTMFSSNKISQLTSNIPYRPYNIHTHTYHTDPALLIDSTVSAYRWDRPYLPCSCSIATTLYIATTYNITHTPCTSKCTHHTAFHNPLHTTNKHTKHICGSSSKMAQDVGMVWKCCVIPI